jgi:hypothetical protein
MPDCFISYSSTDLEFAQAVHRDLSAQGVSAFMAAISLRPGDHWSTEIHNALRESSWVIFLASRAACASSYVQQEIGGALGQSKRLIPVVWDMPPAELPGWVNQIHALDIRGRTADDIQQRIVSIADWIKQDKARGLLVGGALLAGLFWLASQAE